VTPKALIKLLAVLTISLSATLAPAGPIEAAPTDRWVGVSLSQQTATAYIGKTPIHVARVSTGKPGWATPTGTFTIGRRIYNETMDSATTGVPRTSPEGYYLTNVYFTQYLTADGIALHYNWWAPRWVFGRQPTSHGCIAMDWTDAAFFWTFATSGTLVVVSN
jgi:lipoprotein-anchoring transpeptidase ErfK/SrfK